MPVDVAARMGYRLPNIAGVLSSTLDTGFSSARGFNNDTPMRERQFS